MNVPKIIASKYGEKITIENPNLEMLISLRKTKNTCLIVDMKSTLPNVSSEGVMKLSVNNFFLLYPILKQFFSELKRNNETSIKKVVKEFQERLKILELTKQEILCFSAKLLVVLALSGLKRRVRNGNRKSV